MDIPILIALRWDLEFHVHITVFNLAKGTILAQKLIEKLN
jgi:hypothetical protein